MQCYKKLANLDKEEAQLQYCGFNDDICVYAELTHEDGQLSINIVMNNTNYVICL